MRFQDVHGLEQRLDLVCTPEVTGIGDHERLPKAPLRAQRVGGMVDGPDRASVRPIGDRAHACVGDAQCREALSHACSQDHVHMRGHERSIAQPSHRIVGHQRGAAADAENLRSLGEDVL